MLNGVVQGVQYQSDQPADQRAIDADKLQIAPDQRFRSAA